MHELHDLESPMATLSGLEMWTKHHYEHLGWMTLAMKHGYMEKVISYKNGIHHLIQEIEKRKEMIIEEDRKVDLDVLWHKACHLREITDMLFPSHLLKSTYCSKNKSTSSRHKSIKRKNKTYKKK